MTKTKKWYFQTLEGFKHQQQYCENMKRKNKYNNKQTQRETNQKKTNNEERKFKKKLTRLAN